MEIEASTFALRPWRKGDEASLARHARFPHPYTRADAEDWIRRVESEGEPPRCFAIVLDGQPVGGIGFGPLEDVNRRTAEVGYWLGETYWGRGIATEALRLVSDYAFSSFELDRLQAGVFEWNAASCRVLEKAGYAFEVRIHKSIFKDGQLIDGFLYARLREPPGRVA